MQLAVIHGLGYRCRIRRLRDDNQIQLFIFCQFEGVSGVNDAVVLTSMIDKQNLRGFDFAINKVSLILSDKTKSPERRFRLYYR